jgi:hypothetical protein
MAVDRNAELQVAQHTQLHPKSQQLSTKSMRQLVMIVACNPSHLRCVAAALLQVPVPTPRDVPVEKVVEKVVEVRCPANST